MLIHGVRHFGRKKVGARKELCGVCERECLAELWRSSDWWHLFFIPLVPLGTHERWACSLCNQDPRWRPQTRKGFKIAGLFVLVVLFIGLFTIEIEPKDVPFMWGVRVATLLGFVALLYSIVRKPPAVSEEERRKAVVPLSATACVYCHGPLASDPYLHCPTCQVRIYTTDSAAPESAQDSPPDYPEDRIEALLEFPDHEHAMAHLVTCMEARDLWVNEATRKFGCFSVLYWRTEADGMDTVIEENGPEIILPALEFLRELGAEHTVKLWEDVIGLFPNKELPEDSSARYDAFEEARKKKPELKEPFWDINSFDRALEADAVWTRLREWVSRHKEQFTGEKRECE